MGKPKIRIEFIKVIKKFFKFFWPWVHMKKISSELHQWLILLGFQNFRFNLIHENARIWWCKLISDSHS